MYFFKTEDKHLNYVSIKLSEIQLRIKSANNYENKEENILNIFDGVLQNTQKSLPNLFALLSSDEKQSFIDTLSEDSQINFDLAEKLLETVFYKAQNYLKISKESKKANLLNTALTGGSTLLIFTVIGFLKIGLGYLLTGAIISTPILILAISIGLALTGLIFIVGFSFALKDYLDERFCSRLVDSFCNIQAKSKSDNSNNMNIHTFFEDYKEELTKALDEKKNEPQNNLI